MPAYRTRNTRTTLEVTTTIDEPVTPTLAIFSPTPRAFTFPKTDLPYASPSCSPFEPDLKHVSATPPPVRAFSPTSSIGSESSSVLSTSTATSSQVSHRRRRSTISDNERRPKKGDEDYVKRPENAFILFRRKCCEDRNQALEDAGTDDASGPVKKQRQADLSKTISQQWKSLPVEERSYWEDLAKEKKKEHEQMYPNYVYRPQRVKKGKKGKGRRDGEQETDDGISFIMPVPSPPRSLSRDPGHGRRAVSAPTPPPAFQTIQLPTVFMPSCPPSPSGVPRISRRSSYIPPPTDSDPSTRFEYMPQDSALPPTFQRPSFDASSFSYDAFQTFQFDGQSNIHGRTTGIALQSLTIPRESSFMSNNLISPAESIASNLFSPAESIASSLSPSSSSSHCGPFTPADSLSINGLSINTRAAQSAPDCVPENVDGELSGGELGYSGYSSWSSETLWPEQPEVMLADDFDLSSIPPIELGMTMPDQVHSNECDYENGQFGSVSDGAYSDATPGSGQDPFASLFSYEGLNW